MSILVQCYEKVEKLTYIMRKTRMALSTFFSIAIINKLTLVPLMRFTLDLGELKVTTSKHRCHEDSTKSEQLEHGNWH